MTATLTEKQFSQMVVDLARLCGFRVYRTHDSRRSPLGFPDLILCHPKRRLTLYRELKVEGGRLTAEQRQWLTDLQAAGNDALVWRPADWPAIEKILKGDYP